MTPPPPHLSANSVILVSFFGKMVLFFLGTLIFGKISRVAVFENDTGGGLKNVDFWVLNGDFFEK
jgi:hypothetical protein